MKRRCSWLIVPASEPEDLRLAGHSGADVVVLDLAEFVTEQDKPLARERIRKAIFDLMAAGPEIFVQIDPELAYADLEACVWPGLGGLVVSRAETPAQILEIETRLERFESERGILPNTIELVIALETAKGNQLAYEIAAASKRLWGLTLGRADLIMDLRPEPSGEFHLMQYLMQRLILIAAAVGAAPLGAWWRAPDRGLLATPERTGQAARRGRAIGFKGAMCLQPKQIQPLMQGFSPEVAELAAAKEIWAAYRERAKQGTLVTTHGDLVIVRSAAERAQALLDIQV